MKKLLIDCFLLICCLLWHAAGHSTTLFIPERLGTPGDFISVDICIDGADSLAGAQLLLDYDKTILEFISVDKENPAMQFLIADKEKEDKIALVMVRSSTLQQNNAILCRIKFHINDAVKPGTLTKITFVSSLLYSSKPTPIVHETQDGVVRIVDISCYPNPFTPDNNGFNDVCSFVLPQEIAAGAVVKIFGVSGNLMRVLSSQGRPVLQWDGIDANGQQAKPGVYLYVVLIDDEPLHKGTVTLMR